MFQKYKNKKVVFEGIKFDSNLEKNIYIEIKNNNIDFRFQPKYLLQEKFFLLSSGMKKAFREINYIGDFDIIVGDKVYTIDAKGMETQVFKIKAKMFAKIYNREIITIKSAKAFREWLKNNGITKEM